MQGTAILNAEAKQSAFLALGGIVAVLAGPELIEFYEDNLLAG